MKGCVGCLTNRLHDDSFVVVADGSHAGFRCPFRNLSIGNGARPWPTSRCPYRPAFFPGSVAMWIMFWQETAGETGKIGLRMLPVQDSSQADVAVQERVQNKESRHVVPGFPFNRHRRVVSYLFTWNLVTPFLMKSTIWLAAARPALMLASAVSAPIFLGVEK